MASLPHFDLPFRFGADGHAVTVEQDTLKDVTNCVSAILRTFIGQREEMPDFGIPDLTFTRQPLQVELLAEAVLLNEPRAGIVIEQYPDQFQQLAADIIARVSTHSGEVNGV